MEEKEGDVVELIFDLIRVIGGLIVVGIFIWQGWKLFQPTEANDTHPATPPFQIVDVKTGWRDRLHGVFPVVSFKIKNTSNQPISDLKISVTFVNPSTKEQYGSSWGYAVSSSSPLPPGYTGGYHEYNSDTGQTNPIDLPSLQAEIRWEDDNQSDYQYLTTVPVATGAWSQ